MVPIVVNDFLDVPEFKKDWPDFKSVDECQRGKIQIDMEVTLRRVGEDIRVKIEDIQGDNIIGRVLTEAFYFDHPFQQGDFIQFKRKNIIDIYDINRWGVKY